MSWDTIIQWGLYVIAAVGAYIYKDMKQDVKDVKEELRTKISEPQVRQLIKDKIDPLHQDLQEIKDQLAKLTDYIVNRK